MTESSNSLPEARLARMGLTLGAAPQAVGQYAPCLLYTSDAADE